MRRFVYLFVILTALIGSLSSQEIVNVWGGCDPPTQYLGDNVRDDTEAIIYLPSKHDQIKTPAVLICPGGGYAGVSMPYEGHAFAKWLASEGIAGIILKYRLPNQHKEVPFDDAEETLRIIQRNADKWNIDLNKVGIAGFSAGGHLAAVLSNKLAGKGADINPSFTILFYPVISFKEVTKGGTRNNLLGVNPTAADICAYSAEMLVTENTSPTIIFTCDGDESVSPLHSLMYYKVLKEHKIPAALYIFPEGGHGWAMLDTFRYNEASLILLKEWLQQFR